MASTVHSFIINGDVQSQSLVDTFFDVKAAHASDLGDFDLRNQGSRTQKFQTYQWMPGGSINTTVHTRRFGPDLLA